MSIRVDAAEFAAFTSKVNHMTRQQRSRVNKRIREVATPFGREVVADGAEEMPQRGGLAAHITAKGKPTISRTATGVRMTLGKKKGPQIGKFDAGQLRHPSFGVWHTPGVATTLRRRGLIGLAAAKSSGKLRAVKSIPSDRSTWKWVDQQVPAGTFTKAAVDRLPQVADAVAEEIKTMIEELR